VNLEINSNQVHSYQKKVMSYLDGSMTIEEQTEFEAQIRTNPEIEALVKSKEDELILLKSLIPAAQVAPETLSSLEAEMKLSVFNLLKKEPKSVSDRVRNFWEEWTNR
jgi:anti-sigma-K factor RskA